MDKKRKQVENRVRKATSLIRHGKVVRTWHFKEVCQDRNISWEGIQEKFKNPEYVYWEEQEDDKYKLVVVWNDRKDLNVTFTFTPDRRKCRLISVHISYKNRRPEGQ